MCKCQTTQPTSPAVHHWAAHVHHCVRPACTSAKNCLASSQPVSLEQPGSPPGPGHPSPRPLQPDVSVIAPSLQSTLRHPERRVSIARALIQNTQMVGGSRRDAPARSRHCGEIFRAGERRRCVRDLIQRAVVVRSGPAGELPCGGGGRRRQAQWPLTNSGLA